MVTEAGQDQELFKEMREQFFCALISDVLDGLGYLGQALPARIRPVDDSVTMVGRARTMLYADVYTYPQPNDNPYALEIPFVDSLGPNEVAVCACGGTGRIAPWGGLLSTASKVNGAAGAITDGLVRDIRDIRQLGFPVFTAGIAPLDSKGRGKAIATDVEVECAGIRIKPGDILFGDADGCVVIPQAIEREVLIAARARLKGENNTRDALLAGRSLGEVFAQYGVL